MDEVGKGNLTSPAGNFDSVTSTRSIRFWCKPEVIEHILSATIYIKSMNQLAQMNEVWDSQRW